MPVQKAKNAAVMLVPEVTEGVFLAPNPATDGVLVEAPEVDFNPQNTETDEVNGSLDGEGPIPGGVQSSVSFRTYLKGGGIPGLPPEANKIYKACGLLETIVSTSIAGVTFSITGGNTINDSGNGLAGATIGSPIALLIAGAFIGEFIVMASAAGAITVQKMDGSAAGLTNAAAGPTFDIRIGVAAMLASAGAADGFTAIAPWAATAQLYRGAPVWLSANPATPLLSAIDDYTAARVAKIAETLVAPLSATTRAGIPPYVWYRPHSGLIPSHSVEVYMDGTLYKFAGMRGDLTFNWNTAGACWFDVRMSGKAVSKTDAALATPTYQQNRPGTFRDSRATLGRKNVAIRGAQLGLNNELVYPPDPNDLEGFAAVEIVGRRISGSLDPRAGLVATRDSFGDFRTGVERSLWLRLTGGPAKVAGNRAQIVVPNAFYESYKPTNDQKMNAEQIGFFCRGRDDGFRLAIY